MANCWQKLLSGEGVSEAEAKSLMNKKDKRRRNYFKFWTQKEWSDRSNYDMELNTSYISTDDCSKILLAAME